MTRLPASLDDLRGLRAARWIRESTRGQTDRFGPDAQREQQREAIARYGLALALPERVRIEVAGEEGLTPARSIRIPIEGAAEWRAAARLRLVG